MKSFIAIIVFCLLSVGTITAQEEGLKPAQKVELSNEVDVLAEKLGLTVEQKANVAKTITTFRKTQNRIQSSSLSAADKTLKLKAINERVEGNLKTYLSDEQFAKYRAMKKTDKRF